MKNQFLLLLLACLFSTGVFAQVKTADILVNRAFAAVKANDEQAYIALFPTYPQMKLFLTNLVNSLPDTMMKKALGQKMSELTEEVYNKEMKGKFIDGFQAFVAKGRKMGIDWTKATLDSFSSKEHHEPGVDITSMGGKIFFTAEGKEYFIPFSDAIWSKEDNGWFGFEMSNILMKGDDDDDEIIFREEEVSKTVAVPIPPPPPPIVKSKPSVKKTTPVKPATKKPANKTDTKKKTKT